MQVKIQEELDSLVINNIKMREAAIIGLENQIKVADEILRKLANEKYEKEKELEEYKKYIVDTHFPDLKAGDVVEMELEGYHKDEKGKHVYGKYKVKRLVLKHRCEFDLEKKQIILDQIMLHKILPSGYLCEGTWWNDRISLYRSNGNLEGIEKIDFKHKRRKKKY